MRAHPEKGMSPEKLRGILEELGPVYVKLGQMLAVSSTLIPEEYRAELQKLRSAAAPMGSAAVQELLEREYGAADGVFSAFSPVPEGAASVAQVHKAVLKSGETVAVKLLRPGSRELMERDIGILRGVGKSPLLASVRKVADLDMLLDELWSAAQSELDLRAEAEHMERFARRSPLSRCPAVYDGLCTGNVLVMEFIDGVQLDSPDAAGKCGGAEALMGRLALDYARQVFCSGYFHADPHPGNIRVRDGELVWLDLGLMGEVSPGDRRQFARGLRAIVFDDSPELAGILMSMGSCGDGVDREGLAADIAPLLREFKSGALSDADLPKLASRFLSLARRHGIVMPPNVTLLTRGVLALAGLIQTLAPDFDLLSIAPEIIKLSSAAVEDQHEN